MMHVDARDENKVHTYKGVVSVDRELFSACEKEASGSLEAPQSGPPCLSTLCTCMGVLSAVMM